MTEAVTQFWLEPLDTRAGPVALLRMDNGAGPQKPNTFGRGALESLAAALDRLETGDWAGLMLTGSASGFAAGADVTRFPGIDRDLALAGGRAGHELFGRLRALPFPTLAAINGTCVGGGVEIALHCDVRTISSDVRHFACPEVLLGLIPGWGGTQLIPRLVGVETAIRFVVTNPLRQNRMLDGRKARELGFADHLVEPEALAHESLELLLRAIETGVPPREAADLTGAADAVRLARLQLDAQLHGAAPAPYRALDLIEGAATWSLAEGYAREEEALADLLPGPQAQASIYAFDLVERRAKLGVGIPAVPPRPVAAVGIVGAGLMARQLALLFLRRLEVPVVLRDLTQEQVDEALAWIHDELRDLAREGRLDEDTAASLGALASGSTSWEAFAGCDLVLEAVFEELQVKREVLAELERVVAAGCVLATNTSSLSVTAMAEGLEHPERVVGLHFFNPVAVLPLVELVRTPATDDASLATAWEVVQRLRKRGVLVADAPAFVVNRLLTRLTTVLMDALERGNTVEETDEAVLRLGLPLAPSVLLQMVGPRVANHVLHTLHESFPDRYPTFATMDNYAAGRDEIVVREQAPHSVDELHEAVLEALADEIRRLVDDGVVGEAADVDACLILGAGWPLWLGGITPHLDATGVSERVTGRRFGAVAPAAQLASER
jgi:3-hydroxyacyl-CoA dehydrogenase/enoyl-CoA hydratase/carnithine racemase